MTTDLDNDNSILSDRADRSCRVYTSRVVRTAHVLAFATILLGLGGLVGWIVPLSSIHAEIARQMTPESAMCFILCGVAVFFGPLAAPRRWKRRLTVVLRALVLLLVVSHLLEYLPGFGTQEIVLRIFSPHPTPDRMPPNAAAAFLFYVIALCLMPMGPRRAMACQILTLGGLSVGFFALVGFLLHAQIFLALFMAARLGTATIVGLVMLGLAILIARPNRGMVSVFLRNSPAGVVARRLFAPAILAPIAIGWASYNGWRANFYDAGFACSLSVLGSIAVICAVTARSVVELNRGDKERRRLTEAHLQSDARERGAHEASRMKSDFVANVSHELRTPMNGVLGMTSLLLSSDLSAEQREQAETIRQSGDALLTLVNEILDFSKIEAGKVEFELKPFSLQACLDEVIALLSTAARRSRINLIAHVAPGGPGTFVGDMARIRQILINLVGNALKFTDEGEVIVEVSATPREDGRHDLRFDVIDTGIGISSAAMDVLFQPFQQGDASATRRHGGTGLGLAICKRLVELMGGDIGVSSEIGTGSTFQFILPVAAAPEAIIPQADPLPEDCALVLITGPGRYHVLLKEQLEGWGAEVHAMSDPLSRTQLPACTAVLLDRQVEAIHLADRMQAEPVWSSLPRILLDFDEPLAEEEEGLFSKHLLKPLKRSHLAVALRDLAGTSVDVKAQRVATQPLMALTHPLRVLLAEDNFINQKVAVALLGRLGYRTDVAANGVEAVDAVMRQPYDLVLLDIQMPEMDGVEAAAAIRRKLKNRCPRLVALTANAFPGAREQYLGQGFDDYMSKPLLPETLLRILKETGAHEMVRTPSTRFLVRPASSGRLGA
jgi:signal transduction histidine kinase/CheY-like chemotaxis protein